MKFSRTLSLSLGLFIVVAGLLGFSHTASAVAVCEGFDIIPTAEISIPGYGIFANSQSNSDATYSITVPSGTVLPATIYSHAEPSSYDNEKWPMSHEFPYTGPNGAGRSYTSDPITGPSEFSVHLVQYCKNSAGALGPLGPSGSVTVNVNVEPALTGSCAASPSSVPVNQNLQWQATRSGGNGTYGYSWSGTGSLTGTTQNVTKSYSSAGTKSATVVITSGTQSISRDCSATVTSSAPVCSPDSQTAVVNANASFTASGGNSTYSWSGGEPLTTGTGSTFGTKWSTTGTKTVTLTSAGQTDTCSVTVVNAPLSCTPTSQTVAAGEAATLDALGGAGNYIWSGPGANNPGPVGGSRYSPIYSTSGEKTVTVTSGSETKNCTVNVNTGGGTIYVTSNKATTFNIGGAATYNGSISTDGGTWNSPASQSPAGSYTLTPGAISGCTVVVNPPNTSGTGSGSLVSGGTLTFSINYTCTPPQPGFQCSPLTQDTYVAAGGGASFSASGGAGPYSWSAPGGTPASGTGATFSTSYLSTGSKTVTLSDGVNTPKTCTVNVSSGAIAPYCAGPFTPTTAGPQTTLEENQNGTFYAAYGNGVYSWTALAQGWGTAIPLTGSGDTFVTKFTNADADGSQVKYVRVTSGTNYATCSFTLVTAYRGDISVVSNIPTKWTFTGPTPPAAPTASTTSGGPYRVNTGTYTIVPATIAGYNAPVVTAGGAPGASQYVGVSSSIIYTITYTAMTPGSVDIKANGSDTPAAIIKGTAANLTWTSGSIVSGSCSASNGWTGPRGDSGSESTGNLNAAKTYVITCTATAGGNVSDTVTVPVRDSQCHDGIDNDGDGKIDYPVDGGCTDDDDSEPNSTPECSDNVDNADPEDTVVDENDPGCWTDPDEPTTYDPTDTNEQNTPDVTACNDGFDNDGDGKIDSIDDGCASPTDPTEQKDPDIREI